MQMLRILQKERRKMEFLIGIFFLLIIIILAVLAGALAIILYTEMSDDLKDMYENWKNRKK